MILDGGEEERLRCLRHYQGAGNAALKNRRVHHGLDGIGTGAKGRLRTTVVGNHHRQVRRLGGGRHDSRRVIKLLIEALQGDARNGLSNMEAADFRSGKEEIIAILKCDDGDFACASEVELVAVVDDGRTGNHFKAD